MIPTPPRPLPGLSLDCQWESDPRVALPVPGPVREQRGREAGVANQADVGTTVAEARNRVGVQEHLASNGVQIALEIIEGRQVGRTAEEDVIEKLFRCPAFVSARAWTELDGAGS